MNSGPRICEICDELNPTNENRAALWPKLRQRTTAGAKHVNRIVAANSDYVGMVTVGPVARGHCIILPRLHRSAMWSSEAGVNGHGLLWKLTESLSVRLSGIYHKPIILFEHGAPGASDSRPCSISHAHWHLVPSEAGPQAMLLPEYRWERIESPLTHSTTEYLMVSDGRAQHWIAQPGEAIPSQILRRRLTQLHDAPAAPWDWRTAPSLSVMVQTLDDLKEDELK